MSGMLSLSRRFGLALLLVTWVPTLLLAAQSPPNIVVFLIDDMGVMDTSVPFLAGPAGTPAKYPLNNFYRTPNMERLAARGVRFGQFCAMSVCSPSRVSLLTGQNAARHRVTNWIDPNGDNRGPNGPADWNWAGLKPGDVTLPSVLRGAGYRTLHVGKGHMGPKGKPGADPLNVGFDTNVGGGPIGQPGSYFAEHGYGKLAGIKANAVPGLDKYHGTSTFLTDALTLEANRLVSEAVAENKPFYLNLWHYAVHAPFQGDPRFEKNYGQSDRPKYAKAFATLVEGMDKSLGDLMDHLEKLGVADNTLVFFLGDNGSDAPLGDHQAVACSAPLRGGKGSQYEGGSRVPFIAAWLKANPDNPSQRALPITPGTWQRQQAAIQDLYPTVLALTNIPNPKGHLVDGQSLKSLLRAEPDPARAERFLMHYPHAPHQCDYFTTWRDGDWKVIYHYLPGKSSGGSHYQLFNLKDDPFEQNDLAKAHPAELKRLMAGLAAELESHRATYPVDQPGGKPLKPMIP